MKLRTLIPATLISASAFVLAGCQGPKITDVDFGPGYNSLSIHEVVAVSRPQKLEVSANGQSLTAEDAAMVRTFAGLYRKRGRGPLVIAMPTEASNPDHVVAVSKAISEVAWQAGISYEQIVGTTYGRQEDGTTPIVLTFQSYEALASPCPDLSRLDLANTQSNEVRANFGCSIRQNLAKMIINPADLLGDLNMGPSDSTRRVVMLEQFQQGRATGSEAPAGENATLQTLVQQGGGG